MNDNTVFFLDTNILVYAEDRREEMKTAIAGDLIARGIASDKGRLSSQVLSEYFVTVTKKIKTPLDIPTARRRIALFSVMPVVSIDGPMVTTAIGVMERYGLSYWDALIVASAAASGAEVLYTEDLSSSVEYFGVMARNPFA